MGAIEILRSKTTRDTSRKAAFKKPTQEQIVFFITTIVFFLFSLFLDGFFTIGNLITLIRNVSVLGILSVGMAIVVIGRGIDLSQVTISAVTAAWVLKLMESGMSMPGTILLGLLFALVVGLLNGYLIAFIEIPPLFVTLASGICIYGFGRTWLLEGKLITYLPEAHESFRLLGQGEILGIPVPILLFGVIAILGHLFLSRVSKGRFIYAYGDNADAARLTGIAVRPLIILAYALCAIIGYVAGLLMASTVASVDTRIINSTLIFDVILVIVLGGISLIGGRGSIWSVIMGTALIGTMLNGMLILNVPVHWRNITKGLILLGALILDNRLHPVDEETARQGDI